MNSSSRSLRSARRVLRPGDARRGPPPKSVAAQDLGVDAVLCTGGRRSARSISPVSSAETCAGASISPRTLTSTPGRSSRSAAQVQVKRVSGRSDATDGQCPSAPSARRRACSPASSTPRGFVTRCRVSRPGRGQLDAASRPASAAPRRARAPAGGSAGTGEAGRCVGARRPGRSAVPRLRHGNSAGDAAPRLGRLQILIGSIYGISEYRRSILRSMHGCRRLQPAPHPGRPDGGCARRAHCRRPGHRHLARADFAHRTR